MDNIDPMGLVGKAAGREMGLPDGNWKYLYSENWYEPAAGLAVLNAVPLAVNLLDAGVGTAKAAIDDVMGPGSGDAAEAFLVANPAALAKAPQVLQQVGGAAAELGGAALNRAGRSVSAAVEWWHARRPLGSTAGSVQIAPSARLPGGAVADVRVAGQTDSAVGSGLWKVGPHGSMPSPRPAGMQSHHGVNSVWADENLAGYKAGDAPTILMRDDPSHNATRVVFNRVQAEIAKRQGVAIRDIDWTRVSPGTAWRLAEEQIQAAGVPNSVAEEYFRQFNKYSEALK